MKLFIHNHYISIIIFFLVISLIGIYIINNYNTGFFGGFVTGLCSAVVVGLLVTPKKNFLN